MIEVLGLALYGPLAASNRYRLGHYVAGLQTHGINLQISSLLGDEYVRRRFANNSLPVSAMLYSGIERLQTIRQKRYDISLLHCELFPFMPGWLECQLLRARPYIYDFDDAFYLKYRLGKLGKLSPVLGEKFDTVMRGAAAITAGNNTLKNYAHRYNSTTALLPTVVDTDRYLPKNQKRNTEFTIGWIGSPSTAPYLEQIKSALSQLAMEGQVKLVVIGGKAPLINRVNVVEIAWSEATEVELINTFDVGIMPLPDDDWARGKCAFKLIQYMACGIPVIGSRVGANIDVVTPECGFLPSSETEWLDALRAIRDDVSMSIRMGQDGRARIEQCYSLKGNLPILANMIKQVVENKQCAD
jgi:glycosyltransferase involved in cell wall biosynthesis